MGCPSNTCQGPSKSSPQSVFHLLLPRRHLKSNPKKKVKKEVRVKKEMQCTVVIMPLRRMQVANDRSRVTFAMLCTICLVPSLGFAWLLSETCWQVSHGTNCVDPPPPTLSVCDSFLMCFNLAFVVLIAMVGMVL